MEHARTSKMANGLVEFVTSLYQVCIKSALAMCKVCVKSVLTRNQLPTKAVLTPNQGRVNALLSYNFFRRVAAAVALLVIMTIGGNVWGQVKPTVQNAAMDSISSESISPRPTQTINLPPKSQAEGKAIPKTAAELMKIRESKETPTEGGIEKITTPTKASLNQSKAGSCSYTEKIVGSQNDYSFIWTPTNLNYYYSYSQALYNPSEVCGSNTSAKIYGMAFWMDFLLYNNTIYNTNEERNLTIYLSESTVNTFNGWETNGLTQVYSGNVDFRTQEWTWITFSTPFYYTGNNNLVVTVKDQTGERYNNSVRVYFAHDNLNDAVNRTIYKGSNDTPNPGNSYDGLSSHRAWTKFCVECCSSTYTATSTPLCFNFEDYSAATNQQGNDSGLPLCWSRIYSGTNVGYAPHVYHDNNYCSNSNGILLTSRNRNQIGESTVILPSISGITTGTQISFNYKYSNNENNLQLSLGYMTGTTFNLLQNLDRTTTCTSYTYTMTSSLPSGARLAFRFTNSTDNNRRYAFIDDICIVNPSCTHATITCGASELTVGGSTATYNVTGAGLAGSQVSWSYTGTGSVTFSPTTGLSTTVTPTGAGSGNITATITAGNGFCADVLTCPVTINPQAVSGCDDPDTAYVGDYSVTTNDYLPSYSYYNYSLTQQIYEPCEIGKTGNITSIAFYNGGTAKTRTYDIYLVNTTKTAFTSTTDWMTVTDANRVFRGEVTMAAGTWTVIGFDTPFAYTGSNLAVIIDDNTGSWENGMACRVYPANGNQAISVYSDGTNYNPLTNPITYSGTLQQVKNQLKFSVCEAVDMPSSYTVTVSASPAAGGEVGVSNKCDNFTVTATPNNCYQFVNWTENGTQVSTDATYSFTATSNRTLVANFEEYNVSITSDPNPLTCITSGTNVVLTASTDIPIDYSLSNYTFTTGTDASRWYNVTNTTNIMDGGTTTGDYAYSSVKEIGFTFPFGGTDYTQFSVNADGNLRLGPTVTGTGAYGVPFASTSANDNSPKINGFGFDGYFDISNYGNYVHKQVFGDEPNRVLVVEFYESPYSDYDPNYYRRYPWKWQVQLSENGIVQIVYASTAPASYGIDNQVGLCVNVNDGWTVSTTTHQATHFTNGTSTQNAGASSWPGINRWYRFTPPSPYVWTYTGTEGTADGGTYTVSPTENSTYTLTVSGPGCTGKTASVNVTLQINASISIEP